MGMISKAVDVAKMVELRGKLGLTQEELAAKAGVTIRTIQRMESGDRMSADTIGRVAKALGVSYATLTGEPQQTAPASTALVQQGVNATQGRKRQVTIVAELDDDGQKKLDALLVVLAGLSLNVTHVSRLTNVTRFRLDEDDAALLLSTFERGLLDEVGVVDVREVDREDGWQAAESHQAVALNSRDPEEATQAMIQAPPPPTSFTTPSEWAWVDVTGLNLDGGKPEMQIKYGSSKRIYDVKYYEKKLPGVGFVSGCVQELLFAWAEYDKGIRSCIEEASRRLSTTESLRTRGGIITVDAGYDFGDYPPAYWNAQLKRQIAASISYATNWIAEYTCCIAHRETAEPCYLTVDCIQDHEERFVGTNQALLRFPRLRPVYWIRSMRTGEVRYGDLDIKSLLPLKVTRTPLEDAIAVHEREQTDGRPKIRE